ncbi:hypothetical protein BEWA_030940 [Theileria equi strain WA]|uniref:RAP domain-containing protein n=1 Tax=Theileria equi strain WA TaxID=1537102 RepID=L0AYZ6_THEEQ|nr:hypothetical protein BEWA_030940 [Theileria equi strain WA]AFZ80241.1 hypothetical protein BEWA_030940 [Theileria equi strain WA]|eukprot:XP_004829907.1 hypothetical protein BEWA_030940 [Theileria equi strain WA]
MHLGCKFIYELIYQLRVEGTSWSIINLNDDILFDLCSGSLELRLSQRAVKPLIEMVLKKMPEATPDRIVKVICGFSNYFNDFKLTSNSAMWVFLRTKKSEEKDIDALRLAANNSLNMLDSRHGNKHIAFRTAIEYAKVIGMTKINDFKDLTTLSKFMFSISSTVSAFTYHDYQIVSRKMMDIMRTKENWHSSVFSQILWSMYMGRFINIEIFELISSQVMNTIHTLPTDHLTLCIFPLIHFFPLDRQLMVLTLDYTKDILLRIGDCNKHHRFFQDIEVQLVRIIWSIIISDVSECDEKFTKDLLWCISNINWDRFLLHCKVQDIRKISQICTMLELDVFRGKSLDVKLTSLFPSRVLDAVEHDNEMSQDINRISVSQDRVRRVLDKLGVLYRSEFTVYRSIIVDFAVSKDKIEFKPDLLIEVDGPHHYIVRHSFNNHSDEDYELIRNRKTATKYRFVIIHFYILFRLLSLLGLNVATVPWIEGYRGKLDKFVEDILRDGNVPFG